jgi:thymidylate kinase
VGNFFENLFKRVDKTKRRSWIGLTRLFFVFFQGWLEPYMIKRYHPALVMTARCMIIDSAVYSEFYYPQISQRMTTRGKLKLSQQYSRVPFRDLYIFLDTPIEMAMERIFKRISDDHPEISYGRDYWLHLHEHKDSLVRLDQKFRETFHVAKTMAPFELLGIDTSCRGETEVAQIVTDFVTVFLKKARSKNI